MRVPGRLPILALALALVAAPAAAFDMLDIRYFRETGYRWCRGCDLIEAQLQGADLSQAQLRGANLSEADLQRADVQGASLVGANLRGADLFGADLTGANLAEAKLAGASLVGAKLAGARLSQADLTGASLTWADLPGADLRRARLTRAHLSWADLTGADLTWAKLAGADLTVADLTDARLVRADLSFARLVRTDLNGAKVSYASLLGAEYAAATPPAQGHLVELEGLTTLRFEPGEGGGLAQLRTRLAEAGLRDLERRATYALERQITRHKLDEWTERPLRSVSIGLEGAFRWVFFEWPVAYGLYPGRALRLLLVSIGIFALVYLVPLTAAGRGGIYRMWPKERIEGSGHKAKIVEQTRLERLRPQGWWGLKRLLRALQFSVLSAFHIGFREFNVGTWLARVQAHEYTLRATGWVRVVAGVQSLLSVYLLALWALTYFGRPFG